MNSPFRFGQVVTGSAFVNRTVEKQRLRDNFRNGVHTTLISPRRWGKTSLVRQVALEMAPEPVRFVFLDLFSIRNETEFYDQLANRTFKACATRLEEWQQLAGEWLKNLRPQLVIGPDPTQDFTLHFDWRQSSVEAEIVLNLPEKLSQRKRVRVIVCVDEFQNLHHFDDATGFQQRLRAVWQHHQHAGYCLYGSKRSLMVELFQHTSMPFYRFGDLLLLEKIPVEEWVPFLMEAFARTQRTLSAAVAQRLVAQVEAHPYYVQQLAHLLWLEAPQQATSDALERATTALLQQNDLLYRRMFDELSKTQIQFLRALLAGESALASQQTIRQYRLGSSANVSRIKEALEKKEILDTYGAAPALLDPVFGLWLHRLFDLSAARR